MGDCVKYSLYLKKKTTLRKPWKKAAIGRYGGLRRERGEGGGRERERWPHMAYFRFDLECPNIYHRSRSDITASRVLHYIWQMTDWFLLALFRARWLLIGPFDQACTRERPCEWFTCTEHSRVAPREVQRFTLQSIHLFISYDFYIL